MEMVKRSAKKTEKRERPRYNLWQNTAYMISLAWKQQKSVLWICGARAGTEVLLSLTGLLITPVVLQKVETAAPLKELLLAILGFTALYMLLSAARSYLNANTIFGRIELRSQIMKSIIQKMMRTSYSNTESDDFQKKLKKAQESTSSNHKATEAIWMTIQDLLQNGAGFVIYLAFIASLDPFVILLTVVTTVASFFVSTRVNSWGYSHREEESAYFRQMGYLSAKGGEHTIAKDIRLFGMGMWLAQVYDKTLRLYKGFAARGERHYFGADGADAVLTLLRNGIAYAYLISMTLQNGWPASQFLLYFSAIGAFTGWVGGIFSGLSTLHKQSLELSAVREYLDYPEPFRFEEGESLEPDLNRSYEIELRDVSFRYPGAEEAALKHISLRLGPGEKLAVVGLNGAGKTTLVKLICGFYDPTEGAVLLNGKDIRLYNRRDYYRMFSAVFQQFSILPTTVGENVGQSDIAPDGPKLRDCLEKAGLTDKIQSLPDGLNTHLNKDIFEDGVDLSGGEMQRLMLARALYKDAPILVLDEPTAALDPIAESELYQRYNEMTRIPGREEGTGRTSVYISHRLASTRFCDRIILLEEGRIAEEGTHASLLKAGGNYAQLFEMQSRYYRKEGKPYEEQEQA